MRKILTTIHRILKGLLILSIPWTHQLINWDNKWHWGVLIIVLLFVGIEFKEKK